MKRVIIAYKGTCFSPFETGGHFGRTRGDASALLVELHAEQEEVRSRKRIIREQLSMCSRQIEDCREKDTDKKSGASVWLVCAAITMIFGLLFSTTGIGMCGSCGRVGFGSFLMLIGVILAVRAWSEHIHESKDKKNHAGRVENYQKECDSLREQLYKLNLREAEIEESIRAAERLV